MKYLGGNGAGTDPAGQAIMEPWLLEVLEPGAHSSSLLVTTDASHRPGLLSVKPSTNPHSASAHLSPTLPCRCGRMVVTPGLVPCLWPFGSQTPSSDPVTKGVAWVLRVQN